MNALRCCLPGILVVGTIAGLARAEEAALKASWDGADHISGVYHAKDAAKLSVIIENMTADEQAVDGTIEFGVVGAKGEFKAVAVTPIAAARLAGHERAKIPLKVDFGAVGSYELRWVRSERQPGVIENAVGVKLEAIFAPRAAAGAESPWVTILPASAGAVGGYLQDYAAQTGVRRFLLDERFAFDPSTRIGLGMGASLGLSVEQLNAMFLDLQQAGGGLILRVTVPLQEKQDRKAVVEAFRKYVEDGVKRAKGTIKAIVIVPGGRRDIGFTAEEKSAYRALYLAGYDEAKKQDHGIAVLGAGSASTTADLLGGVGKEDLITYVDGVAISDASIQPALARKLLGEKKANLWLLPPLGGDRAVPPAVALAEGTLIVAVPELRADRGVSAHLLGGAVLFSRVHPDTLPYVAVFQGDGYAVAAVAGLSAGTEMDAKYPSLAKGRTSVTPPDPEDGRPPYPNLEVSDDAQALRVVDAAGAPVDCRVGDTLYVPAADHVVYLLQSGSADDLAALLRPAISNRLPFIDITGEPTEIADGDVKKPALTLKLTNISDVELGGTLKLIAPPTAERTQPATLADHTMVPISPAKMLELNLPLDGELPKGPLIVELTTRRGTQRSALVLEKPSSR